VGDTRQREAARQSLAILEERIAAGNTTSVANTIADANAEVDR
jgi:hypothetical protein